MKSEIQEQLLISSNEKDSDPNNFTVYINCPSLNINNETNLIITSKYQWNNFFPKIIMEQFARVANVYFLIIAILQSMKDISYSDGIPVILLPLCFVLLINGLKDFYEDFKRKQSDNEENNRLCKVYDLAQKKFIEKKWFEIRQGDIIKVFNGEAIPADLILLNSSEASGICYVETKNIDGETSLKYRTANKKIKDLCQNEEYLDEFEYVCLTKEPDEFIYQFDASLYKSNKGEFMNRAEYILIDKNSFLLRGSSLQQTEYIIGAVCYVGHYTKSMMNSPSTKSKRSTIESLMNFQIVAIFLLQITLSILGASLFLIASNMNHENLKNIIREDSLETKFYIFTTKTGTWILIFTNFVPISLLVTMETIKFFQALFMTWDINMFSKERGKATTVQASTLNEELGQVEYIFSDKTGTLTKNYMQFKAFSVDNEIYGNYEHQNQPSQNSMILKDEYGEITNVDFNDLNDKLKNELSQPENTMQKEKIDHFLLCLCLCNTVITDSKKYINSKIINYQASSPDENALIYFARSQRYIFLNRSIENDIQIQMPDKSILTYRILHILEYSSERKRMSVIVKCPDDKIRLYSKGADSIIRTMVNDPHQVTNTDKHLTSFAVKGLRTLMIAYRNISNDEYHEYDYQYQQIALDASKKENELPRLYESMEKNLILLGATGIEDQLVDNVEETIDSFIRIGIKVWMLTGDKLDTAKNIAYSCKLFNSDTDLIEINEKMLVKDIVKRLENALKKMNGSNKIFGLLISSEELTMIFSNKITQEMFCKICLRCNSVVCSRVSPKQKAEMVSMIKLEQNCITLAIGDGSNDVGMITEAHVGIGIHGVEGTQAARASDYAITEFSYLKRLLFYHGREAYRRNSYIICYNFYKNILFVMPMFYLGFYNCFSGQTFYDPWIHQLFNTIFATVPPVMYGVYDNEYLPDILSSNGKYYLQGIYQKLFHYKRFWKYVLFGAIEGCLIFFFSIFAFNSISFNGKDQDLWSIGTVAYGAIVIVVNLNILFNSTNHSIYTVFLILLSPLLYFGFVIAMSYMAQFKNLGNLQMVLGDIKMYLVYFELIGFIHLLNIAYGKVMIMTGLVMEMDKLPPFKREIEALDLNYKEETSELLFI